MESQTRCVGENIHFTNLTIDGRTAAATVTRCRRVVEDVCVKRVLVFNTTQVCVEH